jgi:hypothetical protein
LKISTMKMNPQQTMTNYKTETETSQNQKTKFRQIVMRQKRN